MDKVRSLGLGLGRRTAMIAAAVLVAVACLASAVTWLVMRRQPPDAEQAAPTVVAVPSPPPPSKPPSKPVLAPFASPLSSAPAPLSAAPAPALAPLPTPAPRLPHRLQPLYEHAQEFVLDGDWSRVLAAADVYKNGAYPEYTPDEDMALRLYHVCASCPDGEVSGLGQARYIELRLEPVAAEDRRGRPLPRDPGDMIAGEAQERIARTPFERYQTPKRQRIGALERRRSPLQDAVDQIDRVTRFVAGAAGRLVGGRDEAEATADLDLDLQLPPATPADGRHHRSDAQNVHDHGVAAGVRTSIKELSARHGAPTRRGCIEAVQRARHAVLTSEEPEEEKLKALAVLEALTDHEHSALGASEQQVLALALKEIDAKPDAEARRDLAETLIKQLASGQERGMVVCSSGKISRIVGAFDGTGTFSSEARPLWAVREEMATLAARIRDEHGDDEAAGREAFARAARDEYVRRLGMSGHIVGPMIDEMCEGF